MVRPVPLFRSTSEAFTLACVHSCIRVTCHGAIIHASLRFIRACLTAAPRVGQYSSPPLPQQCPGEPATTRRLQVFISRRGTVARVCVSVCATGNLNVRSSWIETCQWPCSLPFCSHPFQKPTVAVRCASGSGCGYKGIPMAVIRRKGGHWQVWYQVLLFPQNHWHVFLAGSDVNCAT